MCKCWEDKPSDRPDFKYIMEELVQIQKVHILRVSISVFSIIFSFMCMVCRSFFFLFSFGPCVVRSSSIDGLCLPFWYLEALLSTLFHIYT